MLKFIEKYIAQSNKGTNPAILSVKSIKQHELSLKFKHYLWDLTLLSIHKMLSCVIQKYIVLKYSI